MRLFFATMLLLASAGTLSAQETRTTWRDYLGGSDSSHYSALKQINKRNVSQLQQVWFYQAGDNANRYGFTTGYYVFALPKKP